MSIVATLNYDGVKGLEYKVGRVEEVGHNCFSSHGRGVLSCCSQFLLGKVPCEFFTQGVSPDLFEAKSQFGACGICSKMKTCV